MKKLNKKEMKQVKAGAFSISGALFGGIANIVKATFTGFNDTVSTIFGVILGFREAGKGHTKMNLKVGNTALGYDDTPKVKAAENIAEQQIKHSAEPAAPNPKHVSLNEEPKMIELDNHHDTDLNHLDDTSHIMDNSMQMIDEFMHF